MRKFVRRNRLPVGAAAGIVLALATGLVVSDSQRRRAVRAEELAAVRLADAETARDDAIKARDESDTVTKFFADKLASADPSRAGKDVTVREVIDKAAQTVGEKFKDKPLLEARLRDEIAATYYSLGLYPSAEAHAAEAAAIYRRTKGEQDPATLSAVSVLAVIIGARGEFSRSEAQHRANLEIEQRVLGNEHSSTLGSMINLAASLHDQGRFAEAEELYRKTLEAQRRVQGEEHPDTLTSMNGLAASLHSQGRYAEGEELFRKTLEVRRRVLGDEHPHTLQSMNNVTSSLAEQGRYVEAEELYRKMLEVRRRVLGDEHPNTLTSMSNLAGSLHAQGRYSEAEALDRQTLEVRRRVLGEEHPDTLESMNNLAGGLFDQGRYVESEGLYRKTLEVRRRVLGEEHSKTLESVAGLAGRLVAEEKTEEARILFLELMAARRKAAEGPSSNPKTLNALAWLLLTCALEDLRDPAAALPLAEKAVEATGGRAPHLLSTLALAYSLTGAMDRAVETLRKALALLPEARTPLRTELEGRLGEYLTQQKSWAEAESLLLGVQQALGKREYAAPRDRKESFERLGKLYRSWDAAEPGKGYAEKAEEWRKKLEEQGTETQESQEPESQTLVN